MHKNTANKCHIFALGFPIDIMHNEFPILCITLRIIPMAHFFTRVPKVPFLRDIIFFVMLIGRLNWLDPASADLGLAVLARFRPGLGLAQAGYDLKIVCFTFLMHVLYFWFPGRLTLLIFFHIRIENE